MSSLSYAYVRACEIVLSHLSFSFSPSTVSYFFLFYLFLLFAPVLPLSLFLLFPSLLFLPSAFSMISFRWLFVSRFHNLFSAVRVARYLILALYTLDTNNSRYGSALSSLSLSLLSPILFHVFQFAFFLSLNVQVSAHPSCFLPSPLFSPLLFSLSLQIRACLFSCYVCDSMVPRLLWL